MTGDETGELIVVPTAEGGPGEVQPLTVERYVAAIEVATGAFVARAADIQPGTYQFLGEDTTLTTVIVDHGHGTAEVSLFSLYTSPVGSSHQRTFITVGMSVDGSRTVAIQEYARDTIHGQERAGVPDHRRISTVVISFHGAATGAHDRGRTDERSDLNAHADNWIDYDFTRLGALAMAHQGVLKVLGKLPPEHTDLRVSDAAARALAIYSRASAALTRVADGKVIVK